MGCNTAKVESYIEQRPEHRGGNCETVDYKRTVIAELQYRHRLSRVGSILISRVLLGTGDRHGATAYVGSTLKWAMVLKCRLDPTGADISLFGSRTDYKPVPPIA